MYNQREADILKIALDKLSKGFALPKVQLKDDLGQIEKILLEVATKMQNNYPYHHPFYAGQMLKPPHTIARLAYSLAMHINPNNHALDGSKASSPMEKEVVAEIAGMFGWQNYLGHLTGGGTMANMEALWVSGKEHPNKLVLASEQSHYTHERISGVLGLRFQKVPCDLSGRMNITALEEILKKNDVGTVVATLGTTGIGSIDPLVEIIILQKKYNFRIHVDAAYGGYFKLANNLSAYGKEQFDSICEADSIVIDPHKHGLQPYGCGCILFRDQSVGRHYKHDSPYTYFSSAELHLGEISLECSRAGASAVALWATLRLFPLIADGEMAKGMANCRKAAAALYENITADDHFIGLQEPELDIVIWGVKADSLSEISEFSTALFHKTTKKNIHLALLNYPARLLPGSWNHIIKNQGDVTLLRSTLMKWEHIDWVDEIWSRITNCL